MESHKKPWMGFKISQMSLLFSIQWRNKTLWNNHTTYFVSILLQINEKWIAALTIGTSTAILTMLGAQSLFLLLPWRGLRRPSFQCNFPNSDVLSWYSSVSFCMAFFLVPAAFSAYALHLLRDPWPLSSCLLLAIGVIVCVNMYSLQSLPLCYLEYSACCLHVVPWSSLSSICFLWRRLKL